MIFASLLFLFLFLPFTLAGYFAIPSHLRNLFLLIMSLLFYAWGEPFYVFLMIGSILVNYFAGLLIHFSRTQSHQFITARAILILCVVINLALLFYFKYTDFFINIVNTVSNPIGIEPIAYTGVSLPIGISFFTFQAMSYVIDVYRKEVNPELNPINCGLYVALFPQLIAGPIVRYHDVAKQIVSRMVTTDQFSMGVQRFIFGLSKKVLIANPLGETTDNIFAVPVGDITTGMAWLAIICYTLQIYFDFAGYSDMAIGLGHMFGFKFLENFDYPYIACSMREFWRRWHISLSTWFRDYLYIPLGGSRYSSFRTYLNLWIVFLLCGLWHGASWNFVIWGALHGAFLVFERLGVNTILERAGRLIQHVYTLLIVIIGWVFFRSESVAQAVHYLLRMTGITKAEGIRHYALLYYDQKLAVTLILGIVLSTPYVWQCSQRVYNLLASSRFPGGQVIADVAYLGLLIVLFVMSTAYLSAGTYNPFIYYRF